MTSDNQGEAGAPSSCCLLDCDLYQSYRTALEYIWPRLSAGGFIFLDEYFSLKFRRARIACDEFFEGKPQSPGGSRRTMEFSSDGASRNSPVGFCAGPVRTTGTPTQG